MIHLRSLSPSDSANSASSVRWIGLGMDNWNGVFCGAFLFVSLLPRTVPAVRLSREEQEEGR
jgi:hypothetical protein